MQLNVIIVDDDETDRYLFTRAAKKSNHDLNVWAFNSGDEFSNALNTPQEGILPVLTTSSQSLLLLDINMPGLSGFDVVDRIREAIEKNRISTDSLVIYICSSSRHHEDHDAAESDNLIRGFIVKPTSADMLEGLVQDVYCS